MPDIELFTFLLPPDAWRKKPGRSTWKMTIEDAAKHHPGATPILSSREVHSGDSTKSHSSGPMPDSDAWNRGER